MKKFIKISVFLLFVLNSFGFSQTIDSKYEVGLWQNFCKVAVTHTFDDNEPNQLAVAVPIFDKFDYNLTLFTPTNSWKAPNWPGLVEASAEGHEIASHTITHPYLNEMSLDEQRNELKTSHDEIIEKIPGLSALTLAYPYCVQGDLALIKEYYFAARACQGQIERSTPLDMMNISSIVCGTEGSVKTSTDLNNKVNSARSAKGWCVFLIHGIDNDGGWSPIEARELQKHVEYLNENDDDFWVDSFGNVVRYIRERDAVSISEISAEETKITLSVTDTLADSIYNYPITIRRELPQSWASATADQNGESIEVALVEVDSVNFIMFDAVPDGGDILLYQDGTSSIEESKSNTPEQYFLIKNYPNPFNPTTTIVYNVAKTGQVNLGIYNTLGEKLETLVNEIKHQGEHKVTWDAAKHSSGTYIYKYEIHNKTLSGKMTLAK